MGSTNERCNLKLVYIHEVSGAVTRLIAEDSLLVQADWTNPAVVKLRVADLAWDISKNVPVLKVADRVYTLASQVPAVFYTIIIADGVPLEDVRTFDRLLQEYAAYETERDLHLANFEEAVREVEKDLEKDASTVPPPDQMPHAGPGGAPTLPQAASPSIPDRIASGAQAASTNIATGAAWLGNKIEEQGRWLESRLTPYEKPVVVPSAARAGLRVTRFAVRKGTGLASWVTAGVASVTAGVVGRVVRYSSPADGQPPDPNSKRTIAAASVVAAVDLYESMEAATRRVLGSTGSATARLVSHKYGREAGDAVHDAGGAALEAGMATWSLSRVGMRTVARRIAKQVAVGVAQAHVAASQRASAVPVVQHA